MRLAGHPDVREVLASSGAPSPVQQNLVDSRLNAFMELHALLRSKGYSPELAAQAATAMTQGREPMAQETKRFAQIYGSAPKNA